MSTFMNYTFQSWNFRGRQGARPFFDLVANIAAEEFGHMELVATTIATMLTGATPETNANGRTPLALRSPLADSHPPARGEKAGRNVRDGYATEHLEIASYQLLERVAQRAGDEDTAAVARQNRTEEELMAQKLEGCWDKAADLSLAESGLAR